MFVVAGAIVRCLLEFLGERRGPFFPGEVTLLGKLDSEGKRLGLPGFGENWSVLVMVRRAQGSRPTSPDEPSPAARLARPKVRARRNGPNRRAGVSRLGSER